MPEIRLFDAHNHLQNYPGPAEIDAALERASAAGVTRMLCNGTSPGDWKKVEALAAAHKSVVPCFGLHPWFVDTAPAGWLELLENFLSSSPSCVGEIGLDKAACADFPVQEEAFRAQLRLAKKLNRPVSIHCVRAWGGLLEILKEERPPAFMLHAYAGSPEISEQLSGLGAYFSFSGAILGPKRGKTREALRAVPPERLLFETEAPERGSEPQGVAELISVAAKVLRQSPEELGGLAWRNAEMFLGGLFPQDL